MFIESAGNSSDRECTSCILVTAPLAPLSAFNFVNATPDSTLPELLRREFFFKGQKSLGRALSLSGVEICGRSLVQHLVYQENHDVMI